MNSGTKPAAADKNNEIFKQQLLEQEHVALTEIDCRFLKAELWFLHNGKQ
jgi:hypothetical protein